MAISKLLVANRSEIAIRVLRAANELDMTTVAIWAEEDKLSLHRFKADESYQVGRGGHLGKDLGPIESYLSIDEVIRVAKQSGAQAIHPGCYRKAPNSLRHATPPASSSSARRREQCARSATRCRPATSR